jgi:hypothetical protein
MISKDGFLKHGEDFTCILCIKANRGKKKQVEGLKEAGKEAATDIPGTRALTWFGSNCLVIR